MTDTIKEFGQVLPDKRMVKIGEYNIDVTKVPSMYTLEVLKLRKSGLDEAGIFEGMVNVISKICQESVPEITPEYLLKKLDTMEIAELYRFIDKQDEISKAIQTTSSAVQPEQKNS